MEDTVSWFTQHLCQPIASCFFYFTKNWFSSLPYSQRWPYNSYSHCDIHRKLLVPPLLFYSSVCHAGLMPRIPTTILQPGERKPTCLGHWSRKKENAWVSMVSVSCLPRATSVSLVPLKKKKWIPYLCSTLYYIFLLVIAKINI